MAKVEYDIGDEDARKILTGARFIGLSYSSSIVMTKEENTFGILRRRAKSNRSKKEDSTIASFCWDGTARFI